MVDFSLVMSNFGVVIGIFLACALGVPVPEEITLLSAGALVSTKQLPFGLAVISGLAGILTSDWTLYFLGRRLGPRFFRWPLLRTVLTESRVKWAESRIRKNGPFVCFIGRFLPGLRVVIFTTSGVLGIQPRVFLAIDALAAVISVSLWISLGHWMGTHFIDAARLAQEIKMVIISILILIAVINISRRFIAGKSKQLSCLLACLFQIIPFSTWAGDVSTLSGNAPLPIPVNASRPSEPGIWLVGIGEGFRAGTQVLGFSAGAAYGMLMFGSNERHHLTLTSVSYGHMVGGLKGADRWYRGNWELRGELFGGAQVNSETRWLTGVAPHLRYNFATGARFIPYVDAGAGVTVTEIRGPDLGGSFQFNLQANVGANYFVRDDMAINIEGRYLHLSSSAISMPNNGVNTLGVFGGVNTFF